MVYSDNFKVVSDNPEGWYKELMDFADKYKIPKEFLCVENGIPFLTLYTQQNRFKLVGSDVRYAGRKRIKSLLKGRVKHKPDPRPIDFSMFGQRDFYPKLMRGICKEYRLVLKRGSHVLITAEYNGSYCLLTVANHRFERMFLLLNKEFPKGKLWRENPDGEIINLVIPEFFRHRIEFQKTYLRKT